MALPAIAPIPPSTVWKQLAPEEWDACLDAWIALAEMYLLLPRLDFESAVVEGSPVAAFVTSYFHELPALQAGPVPPESSKAKTLRRICFLLTHRALMGVDIIPPELLSWTFLADLAQAYPRSEALRSLFSNLWERKEEYISLQLQKAKRLLLVSLDSIGKRDTGHLENDLRRLCALLRASPEAGVVFVTGSDIVDSLTPAYTAASGQLRKRLVALTYLGLTSLIMGTKPNLSLLYDHLYTLQAGPNVGEASHPQSNILLKDLLSDTPFLQKLRKQVQSSDNARAKAILSSLEKLGTTTARYRRKLSRQKREKGKGPASDEFGHGAFGEVHVHRWSLITQVQDLFPDLGSGFVHKLLDEYNDDVEKVTAHLLDGNLPPHLAQADRSEEIPHKGDGVARHLRDPSTPPLLPERRNVFDNDDFDQLNIDLAKLHVGRKGADRTADQLLSDRATAPNKAAILSALATFDSDDDEHDDTYDVDDVGGTVDTALPGSEEADALLREEHEETLFNAYKLSPEVFERDSATRRGKARAALKSETGMTDEAIEGWGLMLGRDQRKLRRLEAKFSMSTVTQRELARTSYRASPAGSDADESDSRQGRGGYRGRGRGGRGGRGGRRGSVNGPASDKDTQVSRQRKEANKSSRANHNRKGQHAKKMARAGFPG